MDTIDSLASKLSTYLEPAQVNLVRRAYYYAAEAHDGQTRRSGEPAFLAVVCGSGYGYLRPDGIAVVPVGALSP